MIAGQLFPIEWICTDADSFLMLYGLQTTSRQRYSSEIEWELGTPFNERVCVFFDFGEQSVAIGNYSAIVA
jgi:hypothetical protein